MYFMKTSFVARTRLALRTAQFTNDRKAFCVVYQMLDVDHARILSESVHLLEFN